jgi:hypothetical protein
MSWAILIDDSGWRAVDAKFPDESNPELTYPDYSIEYYMATADGPPPSPARNYLAEAMAETARLRSLASYAITPLQYAVDVDDATAADITLLKSWKKYVVALSRLPDQAGYPETISWPVTPA